MAREKQDKTLHSTHEIATKMTQTTRLFKRPKWKRTNLRTGKRTGTSRKSSPPPPTRDQLLAPPQRPPKRTRSVSPVPRKGKISENDATVTRRQRRNSAGPTYDSTPYSLTMDYTDQRTGKGQDHFVETLSRHSRTNPKFRIRRLAKTERTGQICGIFSSA